jgi:hypothetical protein
MINFNWKSKRIRTVTKSLKRKIGGNVPCKINSKTTNKSQTQWFMPIISATWETEIGRIAVQGQFGQKVSNTPSGQISQAWWFTAIIPSIWEA